MSLLILTPLIVIAAAIYQLRNVGRRPRNFPPGPPTLPLIGNLHQIPRENPHHQHKKWAEEYGPVYSLILGTQVMIVISSSQAVRDLLEKRSAIYSSRPEAFLGMEIASGGLRVGLMPYGERWRMIRRMLHSILHASASEGYDPYQELESKQMMHDLLEDPAHFRDHIRRLTNSFSTQMAYGFRTTSIDDRNLNKLYEGFEKLSEVAGGSVAAVLDVYPIFRKLPGFLLPSLRYAQELHRREKELYLEHWMGAKERSLKGTSKPCLCEGIIESQKTHGFSDELAAYISGTILEAGSDTTANTLVGFVQAMLLYPAAQERARQELDGVCGAGRLPALGDWGDLPYVRACVKETLRWFPTVILGLPHAATRDDEYMGHRIPAGATVLMNIWAINTDPGRYGPGDPRAFDPSRFEGDGRTSAEAAAAGAEGGGPGGPGGPGGRDQWTFGAGRRVCPGMHVADRSLFLGVARLLWGFDLERAPDGRGGEVTPDPDDLTQGLVVAQKPFPSRITPRSNKHAQVIREEWEACQALLDEDKQWREIPDGKFFASSAPSVLKS